MRKFLLLLLLFITLIQVNGQGIVAYPDTTICSSQPVWLHADIDGSYGTLTYEYASIPFAPEPVGGTVHNMTDDTHVGPLSIGFDFCFFGEVYDKFYIASNGWISFKLPNTSMDLNWTPNGPIPDASSDVPKAAIFAIWTDWDSGSCTNCIHHELVGVAPNRKLIISYTNIPLFLCTTFEGVFQIVLHETTNKIENHLTDVEVCAGWDLGIGTQGIINEDGTEAFTIAGRNATNWSASNESYAWLPSAITWYETVSGAFVGTGDSIEVAPTVTTSYTAEVLLCDGTTYTDEVIVTVATPYVVNVDIQNISCFGNTNAWIDVDVTGNTNPVTYTWSDGSVTDSIFNLGPGTYTITIQEEDGCAYFQDIVITEPTELLLDTVSTSDVICFGGNEGSVILNADGGVSPYLFSFDGVTYQTDSNFLTMEAGIYTFTVKDAYGCITTFDGVVISQPEPTLVEAGPNAVIEYGSSTPLNATTSVSPIVDILWSPAEGLSCTDCLQPIAAPTFNTTYYVVITDENGCLAIDSVTVWVDIDFNVPNAFTPNDDGLNDEFNIQTEMLISYYIAIYNRWGDLVFTSDDINDGWDGTLNGVLQEIGTYMYVIESVTTLNTPITKTGTLTLLR